MRLPPAMRCAEVGITKSPNDEQIISRDGALTHWGCSHAD
jgi:hypothetical protein